MKNLNQTNKTLEKEKNNIDTDESKERIARERLGMIKEGEISLQEAQEGESASTTAADSAETTNGKRRSKRSDNGKRRSDNTISDRE